MSRAGGAGIHPPHVLLQAAAVRWAGVVRVVSGGLWRDPAAVLRPAEVVADVRASGVVCRVLRPAVLAVAVGWRCWRWCGVVLVVVLLRAAEVLGFCGRWRCAVF